jgi:signal transduction histidine kinase
MPAVKKQLARKMRSGSRASAPRKRWPSEAEQTLEALRSGLVDAVIVPQGQREGVYALKTFDELAEANTQLNEAQQRLLVLMNERERMMQDLHDGCIQSIYAVGLSLEDCRELIAQDPVQAAQKVAQATASLNLVIQELRLFISGATRNAEVDLARDIARAVETLGARGVRFELAIGKASADALSQEQASQLLQIAREALSNIVRHAKAKAARISLRKRGATVRLEIADDGVGFDRKIEKAAGLGLHHIAARVQKLGGRLELRSKPREGCRVLVELAV